MSTFSDDLKVLVKARIPVIDVVTFEEDRLLKLLVEGFPEREVFVWTASTGFQTPKKLDGANSASVLVTGQPLVSESSKEGPVLDPVDALKQVAERARPTQRGNQEPPKRLFVFRDLHTVMQPGSQVYRFVRDLASELKRSFSTLILCGPVSTIPVELQKDVAVIDMPLPDADELAHALDVLVAGAPEEARPKNGAREAVIRAGMGLTEQEFVVAVTESLVRFKQVVPSSIIASKKQIARKSGVIELFQPSESLDQVGGLDLLKDWLRLHVAGFTKKAEEYGLRAPKGLLLMGPPGTGKTMVAKAAASLMQVPLLMLHADQVFSKYVGESEQNIRRVLKTAEAMQPCILFMDEVDRLLAGSSSTSSGDSGVSARVFGTILTWQQDTEAQVLVIGTTNNPMALRPEFIRRFDECFFVDLPGIVERAEIFRIHLTASKRDPKHYDLDRLANASENYSGAEIEKAINEAKFKPFSEGRDFTTDDIIESLGTMKTVYKTRQADVEQMRAWGDQHSIPAARTTRAAAAARAGGVSTMLAEAGLGDSSAGVPKAGGTA